MFHHITINIAYPSVKNDDGVCVLFVSLTVQSKGSKFIVTKKVL